METVGILFMVGFFVLPVIVGIYRAVSHRNWVWLALMVLLFPALSWIIAWIYLGSRKSPNAVGRLSSGTELTGTASAEATL